MLISMADKVHNARAILNDFLHIGDEVWKRFKPSKDGTLCYYRSLADAVTGARGHGPGRCSYFFRGRRRESFFS